MTTKDFKIQVFKHPQFGEIRVTGTSDEPLFCLVDICKVFSWGLHRVYECPHEFALPLHSKSETICGMMVLGFGCFFCFGA